MTRGGTPSGCHPTCPANSIVSSKCDVTLATPSCRSPSSERQGEESGLDASDVTLCRYGILFVGYIAMEISGAGGRDFSRRRTSSRYGQPVNLASRNQLAPSRPHTLYDELRPLFVVLRIYGVLPISQDHASGNPARDVLGNVTDIERDKSMCFRYRFCITFTAISYWVTARTRGRGETEVR